MKQVSVFEGKNKFSEIVSGAADGEPQLITKNGKKTAVLISFHEYKRLTARKESFSEFLLNSPIRKAGVELDLTRSKEMGRPTLNFSEED